MIVDLTEKYLSALLSFYILYMFKEDVQNAHKSLKFTCLLTTVGSDETRKMAKVRLDTVC